ncbi:MAG: ATP-binding protein [Crocinitomicaceae bacterium]
MTYPNNVNFEGNNDFFRLIFKSIEEGLIIADANGVIVFINFRSQELFGYTEAELIGQKVELLLPRKYQKNHPSHRHGYMTKPTRKTMGSGRHLEARRKNGSAFYTEISLNHIDITGSTYVVALITDITKRVEAEERIKQLNTELEVKVQERTKELEESQLLYTAVARNFPNGTINVFDENLNYIFAEGKELFNLGITSKKLIGTSYLARLSPAIRPTIETALNAVFTGETKDFELEHKDQYYNINAVPLANDKGEIDKILVVEKNITQDKLATRKLEEALEKEKELNEMKSRFVSMASHEFRTPLSTILSSNSLIEKYIANGSILKTEKHLKRIKNSVKGLTDILNDFLSTDKLESNLVQAKKTHFNFQEFIDEVIEELQAMCQPGQKIISDNHLNGVIDIYSDRNILKNIMFNLITNAIKYSNENDTISLNSEIVNCELSLDVIDCGIGIPQKDQAKLFSRFYRAENATNIKGTGLGLVIVKSYLNLLDGKISYKSREGEGSCFSIKIPISNEQ